MAVKNNAIEKERVEFRTTAKAKHALQQAAAAVNKNISEFVRDSALRAAADTLSDRRRFALDGKTWRAFLLALEAPPKPRRRLKRLLQDPSPFE